MTVETAPVACGSCGAELARGSRRRSGTSVLCAGCRGRHLALHRGREPREWARPARVTPVLPESWQRWADALERGARAMQAMQERNPFRDVAGQLAPLYADAQPQRLAVSDTIDALRYAMGAPARST